MLTAERLRELVSYDEATGVFRWKISPSNNVKVGQVAGAKNTLGYIAFRINRQYCYAHRMAWLYVHGSLPKLEIDHINQVKDDNRLCNLREAPRSLNSANCPVQKNNKCGLRGVHFGKKEGKWIAQAGPRGTTRWLGAFDTPELAHAAYCEAVQRIYGHITL